MGESKISEIRLQGSQEVSSNLDISKCEVMNVAVALHQHLPNGKVQIARDLVDVHSAGHIAALLVGILRRVLANRKHGVEWRIDNENETATRQTIVTTGRIASDAAHTS